MTPDRQTSPRRGHHDVALAQVLVHRLIPIVVIENPDRAAALAHALISSGLPIAEVTLRTRHALTAMANMAKNHGILVGAGTVTTVEEVEMVHRAGARFVVTPGLDPEIVRRCQDLAMPVLPGVATATEVQAAIRLGLDTVKLFPVETIGGLGMISALAGPFPNMRFAPSGGINAERMPAYLRHPAVAVVGGSWMVPAQAIESGDWDRIASLTQQAVAAAQAAVSG